MKWKKIVIEELPFYPMGQSKLCLGVDGDIYLGAIANSRGRAFCEYYDGYTIEVTHYITKEDLLNLEKE